MKIDKCFAVVLLLTFVPVFVLAQDHGNNFNLIWAEPDEITEVTNGFVDQPQAFAATNNMGGSPKEFMEVGLAEAMVQFENPPVQFRPLQMISFMYIVASRYSNQDVRDLIQANLTGKSTTLPDVRQSLREGLNELKARGLGGVLCNVTPPDYLQDEMQWTLFEWGLETCKELGLRVWIYDEDGYPSGAAGGLVLKKDPSLEAQEQILDASSENGYRIRAAYEGTHASNNFFAIRRYPNIINTDAVKTFIQVTHAAYYQRFQQYFGSTIEAFFTDEPSLIACSLGLIPEKARKNVFVVDPPDTSIQRVPAIPWVDDLPQRFQERYGYDVTGKISSLFGGNREEDRKIRRDYWSMISDMVDERFFGQLQKWCGEHGVASSGHALCEDRLDQHPPLNGNLLRNLQQMQIPGMDMLNSNPLSVFEDHGITAAFAGSAAFLNGTRRVMTEFSDHTERYHGGRATLENLCAGVAWQAIYGVTDVNLLYLLDHLTLEEHKRFGDFVGRLGALLTPARRVVPIAFYYPVYDTWTWYRPTTESLWHITQPEILHKISDSFWRTGAELLREGHSYCIVDHQHLAEAKVKERQLEIEKHLFDAVLIPAIYEIPPSTQNKLQAWRKAGGNVIEISGDSDWRSKLNSIVAPPISSAQKGCLMAQFERDGASIILLTNPTNNSWEGLVQITNSENTSIWHFADGTISPLPENAITGNKASITLHSLETIALVSNP